MGMLSAVHVDPSNSDQLRAWDGAEGAYWAAHAERFDRSIAAYHAPFMRAASIGADDRVLDVGCGTGEVARDAARQASTGSVLGVDLSAAMLDVARRKAADEQLTNVRFEQVDAQIHAFEAASFDVVLSRTAAMFFGDRRSAFVNLARALRPGGRMVLLTWQRPDRNEWLTAFSMAMAAGRDMAPPPPDAPGPFALADPDHLRALLTDAGFSDIHVEGRAEGMWFGESTDDAFDLVSGLLGWMLEGLGDDDRARALDDLRATIAAHETPDGIIYGSGTWTTTATRS